MDIKIIPINEEQLLSLIKMGVKEVLNELQPNGPTAQADELMDLGAAAKYLKVAEQTLYSYTSQRKISFLKKGKKLYFRRTQLDSWLESGRRKTIEEIAADAQLFTSKTTKK